MANKDAMLHMHSSSLLYDTLPFTVQSSMPDVSRKHLAMQKKRKAVKEMLDPKHATGLFIQHAFAEPVTTKKRPLYKTPSDIEALSRGMAGDVFVSKEDRSVVLKCFEYDDEALEEYAVATRVMQIAPQYTAGPADLFLKQRDPDDDNDSSPYYYVMRTLNAGPTIHHRTQHTECPFSADELCLCVMQAIHFTLLLGNQIRVADIHDENVCVSLSGAQIQVKWIDFGYWLIPNGADAGPSTRLSHNAVSLCEGLFWDEASKGKHPEVIALLQHFNQPSISLGMRLRAPENMIKELKRVAVQLSKHVLREDDNNKKRDTACVSRAKSLLADIITACLAVQGSKTVHIHEKQQKKARGLYTRRSLGHNMMGTGGVT